MSAESLRLIRDQFGNVVASLAIRFPQPPVGAGATYEFRIDAETWARMVAGVSAQGAAPERVALFRNFHMYGAPPAPAEPDGEGWDGNGSPVPAPPLGD